MTERIRTEDPQVWHEGASRQSPEGMKIEGEPQMLHRKVAPIMIIRPCSQLDRGSATRTVTLPSSQSGLPTFELPLWLRAVKGLSGAG